MKSKSDKLSKARHELSEMCEGTRRHGRKGQSYWGNWLGENDWWFEIVSDALREDEALQAYQPTISKTETTSCEWCDGKEHIIDSRDYTCLAITGNKLTAWGEGEAAGYINYCPNCGRRLED